MAPTKKPTKRSAKRTSAKTSSSGITDAERDTIKELAKERRAEERWARDRAAGEKDLLEKVAEMPKADRVMATKIHAIVTEAAPDLMPRTWYGMPAWARDGKVLCFFQGAEKFEARYATFGFNDNANLDKDNMWPTSFALAKLTAAEEKKIRTLLRRATR